VGLLGEGGMAQVYLGHHDGLGRPVAVKRLRRHLADVEQARARMRAEAEIAQALRHDHIVDVLDLVTDQSGDTYLVMEHLAGEPLSARLSRAGALPMSEILAIAMQIADALAAVHRRGIVHRDLKTENVLVGLDPEGEVLAKLIDFGVAEIVGSPDGALACNSVVGTPESMSPEQATAGTIDRRSDIYSFGVLLYEMVTGVPPFQCQDLSSLLLRLVKEAPVPPSQMPGAQKQLIPPMLERLILDCLAKDPADRPQDMNEVSLQLDLIAAEYRNLTDAVERAMSDSATVGGVRHGSEADAARWGETERTLEAPRWPVDEVAGAPVLMPPSAMRAVGTTDIDERPAGARTEAPAAAAPRADEQVPAPGQKKARPSRPSPAAKAEAADPEEVARLSRTVSGVIRCPPVRDARPKRRRRRARRAARTGLFFAVLVAGVAGLVGAMAWTSADSPAGLELPWRR
jgi:tRNA A-37 threonylcarbamoyl transferase component Bud32